MRTLMLSLLALVATVTAECGCGYTISGTLETFALFTDLLETDFLHVRDVTYNSSYDIGWIPQNYNESASVADGPYGMEKATTNLVPNYIKNECYWAGPGVDGPDPGLQLWVRSHLVDNDGEALVPSAEIVTQRDDILYGSFRIAMKTTGVNGTCGAFYFYGNDSQEIDVEILSAQQDSASTSWPVHLVVQNTSSTHAVNDTSSAQVEYFMAFDTVGPDANYNEYRFDWLPDRIDYYVNDWPMWTTRENIPTTPGRIHISHWSNGNDFWTSGPPTLDAKMTVSYVKAYFNSTNTTRISEYAKTCGPNSNALQQTCQIPDQNVVPDPDGPMGNKTAHTFFFTLGHNMTPDQTIYDNPLNGDASGLVGLMERAIWTAGTMILIWIVFSVSLAFIHS